MALKDRLVEIVFALKDQFSKPSRKIKGAYKDIGDSATKAESRVKRSAKAIGSAFTKIGAAVGGLFAIGGTAAAAIKPFADELDRLSKTAQKLGTTTEELSKLGFAAEQTGVKQQTLFVALQRMTRRLSEAARGSGVAVKALAELGLSAEALQELTVDQQFREIADAFEGVQSQSDKVRLAFALFDSEGVSLVNTLEGGRASLTKFGDELERIGGVITTDAAKAAEQYNDSLTRLEKHWDALANKAGPPVLNFFNRLFEAAGIGQRSIETLRTEITKLETKLENAGTGNFLQRFRSPELVAEWKAELGALQAELFRAENEEIANEKRAQDRKKAQADQARAQELAATQKHVDTIKAEFDKLVERPKKEKPAEELDLIDLSGEISKSMSALAQGDFDKAVEDARGAGEMLNRMREAGVEADIVLDGMAMRIRNLAVEAAKQKQGVAVKVEIDTVTLSDVQRQLDGLAAPITVPIRLSEPQGTAELQWEAEKRGAKL